MLRIFKIVVFMMMQEITSLVILQSIATKDPITNETMYADYPYLRELNMSHQRNFEFPNKKVLLIHHRLSAFICNNCGVNSIYNETFSKLPHLTLIELKNNFMEYVHPDAFMHNTRLDKIDFSGNKLVTLNPEATLRHISSLSIVNFSQNPRMDINLVKLASDRLMILSCNYCATTFLDRNTFADMPRISQINLKENSIEHIFYDALESLQNVKTLTIDGNRNLKILSLASKTLKRLSAENCALEGTLQTSNLPALSSVNVRGNQLTHIDEIGLVTHQRITSLLLDDNKLEKIPDKLIKMPELQRLCLDRNLLQPYKHTQETLAVYKMRALRQNCTQSDDFSHYFEYHLPSDNGTAVYRKKPVHSVANNGSTIDLSGRNIVFIEYDYLIDYEGVKKLNFNNNYRFDFKESMIFLESRTIEDLLMINCAITALYHTTFEKLPNLKSVHLQGKHNPQLTYINLARNELRFISDTVFQDLPKLQTLILNENTNLTNTVMPSFPYSNSLRYLSCANCSFERLDSQTLKLLPNLRTLNLQKNPLNSFDIDLLDRVETFCVEDTLLDGAFLNELESQIPVVTKLEHLCEEHRLSERLSRNYESKSFSSMTKMIHESNLLEWASQVSAESGTSLKTPLLVMFLGLACLCCVVMLSVLAYAAFSSSSHNFPNKIKVLRLLGLDLQE
ncbi:leucine-rich repeat and death domain-containing protein 1 [Aedes albopictus]|uniref:Uncharacterized protein n=1 Tax=Aedes albopictus TaxID=7160 RepID=A0ABM1ZRE3_AEDAL|nr:leucine-rich repeat and death domain-containing protein 1-like [Aedes albopictus]